LSPLPWYFTGYHSITVPIQVSDRNGLVFQLTAATAAVITKLSSSIHNELTLEQFVSIGMLLQFESLVSCHSDEMGMLEDMDTAMHDLACVRFVVTSRSDSGKCTAVTLSGSRLATITSTPLLLFACFCLLN